jgi:hypothetical protein
MSILESTRKMTTNEKMCYDMGYAQGKQDAVPVVRCKECEYYNTTGCSKGFGWCENIDRGTSDNFYCANGKQLNKESEE